MAGIAAGPTLELAAPAEAGPEWDAVFAAGPGVQSGRSWYGATAAAALPPGAEGKLLLLRQDGQPAGILPLLLRPDGAGSLTSPYSVLFQPLVAPGVAGALGLAVGHWLRRRTVATTTLDALDPAWPGLPPLLTGLRRAGLVPLRFDHFGNWHEVVAGLDWPGYLARRPGALRETVRRKSRLAEREGVRFQVVGGEAGLAEGLAAYEEVYRRSWKVPEPFPGFTEALLRRLAPEGRMRLGIMWRGPVAVAAQYWTVGGGVATVLKLAHDEAAAALSPGTLLTAHMIRVLLAEGVGELDFGRGDDPYKRQWVSARRQRIGVVLVDPRRPRGFVLLARHAIGRAMRLVRS